MQNAKALARERLNTIEEGLSKPLVSAVSGALSTAVGALIPIVPFFFMAAIPGSDCCRDRVTDRTFRRSGREVSDYHSLLVE
jgi:hypothetical protein